jgi:hypothetical protein
VPVTTHELPSIDEEPAAPAPSAVAQGRRKTSSRGRAASGGAQAQSEKSPPDVGVQKAADTDAHARGGRSGAAVDAAPVAGVRRKRESASLGDDVSTDRCVAKSVRALSITLTPCVGLHTQSRAQIDAKQCTPR